MRRVCQVFGPILRNQAENLRHPLLRTTVVQSDAPRGLGCTGRLCAVVCDDLDLPPVEFPTPLPCGPPTPSQGHQAGTVPRRKAVARGLESSESRRGIASPTSGEPSVPTARSEGADAVIVGMRSEARQ